MYYIRDCLLLNIKQEKHILAVGSLLEVTSTILFNILSSNNVSIVFYW